MQEKGQVRALALALLPAGAAPGLLCCNRNSVAPFVPNLLLGSFVVATTARLGVTMRRINAAGEQGIKKSWAVFIVDVFVVVFFFARPFLVPG